MADNISKYNFYRQLPNAYQNDIFYIKTTIVYQERCNIKQQNKDLYPSLHKIKD